METTPQIVDPTRYPGWDDLILSSGKYSFFHSSAWAKVLSESYGYRPLFFTLFHHDRLLSLIPVMEVRSILTGRRGVSLPFSDDCEPILHNKEHFETLLNDIIQYGDKRGWKTVELRGGNEFLDGVSPAKWFYGHTLDLGRDPDTIFREFQGEHKKKYQKGR